MCLTGYVIAFPSIRCNTTTASEETEKAESRRMCNLFICNLMFINKLYYNLFKKT